MNEKEIMKEYAKEQGNTMNHVNRSRSNSLHNNTPNRAEQLLTETPLYSIGERIPKAKTEHQEEYVRLLKNREKKIVFATGPAGTGKTMFACCYGLHMFLLGQYERIVFTRPLVSVDEEIGFLPGTMEEKMAPWVRPMMDVLAQYLTEGEIQALMEEKLVEIVPLGFMRGRTFLKTWIIADEMQNATTNQMKMLTTRLGHGSRMIITGDLEQCDLPATTKYAATATKNGLEDFLERMEKKGCPNTISQFEFGIEDVQRETVVKDVLHIYSNS
jgi:phosphate starvation-inducible PhoH-like protein